MDDLISRQAAIDALAEHEKSRGHNYILFVDIVSECAEIIRDLPSAQPEIIRCNDCKYYDADNFQCETDKPHSGTWFPESYCDRAERRS